MAVHGFILRVIPKGRVKRFEGRREMPDLPTLDWPGAPQVDPDILQPGSLPPVLLPEWKLQLAEL